MRRNGIIVRGLRPYFFRSTEIFLNCSVNSLTRASLAPWTFMLNRAKSQFMGILATLNVPGTAPAACAAAITEFKAVATLASSESFPAGSTGTFTENDPPLGTTAVLLGAAA